MGAVEGFWVGEMEPAMPRRRQPAHLAPPLRPSQALAQQRAQPYRGQLRAHRLRRAKAEVLSWCASVEGLSQLSARGTLAQTCWIVTHD